MPMYEQLRAIAILLPVAGLLALGFCLTFSSGVVAGSGSLRLRSVMSSLTRTILTIALALIGLLCLQHLVGYRA